MLATVGGVCLAGDGSTQMGKKRSQSVTKPLAITGSKTLFLVTPEVTRQASLVRSEQYEQLLPIRSIQEDIMSRKGCMC